MPSTGDSSAGVEFVGTSVTSTGPTLPIPLSFIQTFNPHIKYANTTDHGYLVLDINQQRVQGDYYFVNTITVPNNYAESQGGHWKSMDGDGHLSLSSSAAPPPSTVNYITPPTSPQNPPVGREPLVSGTPQGIIVGAYPNPFTEDFYITYNLFKPGGCELKLIDLSGKTVWNKKITGLSTDLQFTHVQPGDIPVGLYVLTMEMGKESASWRIVKTD